MTVTCGRGWPVEVNLRRPLVCLWLRYASLTPPSPSFPVPPRPEKEKPCKKPYQNRQNHPGPFTIRNRRHNAQDQSDETQNDHYCGEGRHVPQRRDHRHVLPRPAYLVLAVAVEITVYRARKNAFLPCRNSAVMPSPDAFIDFRDGSSRAPGMIRRRGSCPIARKVGHTLNIDDDNSGRGRPTGRPETGKCRYLLMYSSLTHTAQETET